MPGGGQVPDLFKGFREELGNIEKRREQKQAQVLEMASRIEMADQSTMFGGDYSEAQQMAQWMTDHLDDFASSTEGLIEFQQMAQQLSSFIDASEAYKKQNFGSADGNAQAGTWMGWYQRNASGVNPSTGKWAYWPRMIRQKRRGKSSNAFLSLMRKEWACGDGAVVVR